MISYIYDAVLKFILSIFNYHITATYPVRVLTKERKSILNTTTIHVAEHGLTEVNLLELIRASQTVVCGGPSGVCKKVNPPKNQQREWAKPKSKVWISEWAMKVTR